MVGAAEAQGEPGGPAVAVDDAPGVGTDDVLGAEVVVCGPAQPPTIATLSVTRATDRQRVTMTTSATTGPCRYPGYA